MTVEALQQTLFDEQRRMEQKERLTKAHQAAFRAVFNFVEAHDPPGSDAEFWLKTCRDMEKVSGEHMNNDLCQKLLSAALEYLSDKVKKHEKKQSGQ